MDLGSMNKHHNHNMPICWEAKTGVENGRPWSQVGHLAGLKDPYQGSGRLIAVQFQIPSCGEGCGKIFSVRSMMVA